MVDPDAVKVRYDEGGRQAWKATMDVTKDQLNAAPEYKYQGKFNDQAVEPRPSARRAGHSAHEPGSGPGASHAGGYGDGVANVT